MSAPLITVGLPVYQGENYLAQALDSLLAQTCTDFSLIISDNASTDRTAEIARDYAAKDPRIQYVPLSQNLGAAWNFNHVFHLSHSPYFKWAAHDDICQPTFLARCLEALQQNPEAVLAYPQAQVIDPQGVPVEDYHVTLNTSVNSPSLRFADLILSWHRCYEIFGLIRSDVLQSIFPMGNYAGADRTMLAELALRGPFVQVPQPLFFARRHPGQSVQAQKDDRQRTFWFDPRRKGEMVFPDGRILYEYLKVLRVAPLFPQEKRLCYLYLLPWLRKFGKRMTRDFLLGLAHCLPPLIPRNPLFTNPSI